MDQDKIRNVAVIAHVDHGKTTLIDALLKQTHLFRDNQEEMGQTRILDSNDLERERGITILAKNCAVFYKDYKINIIDTPGHADFSGEVERTLNMADGALLIVDAQEGPMPQTRFVLRKALELGLKIIVVVNKIDKKLARVEETLAKTESLFLELATREDQLDFKVLYAIGRQGVVFEKMPLSLEEPGNITPLMEAICKEVPPPKVQSGEVFKMQVSSLDYDNHLGRMVIGKIHQGEIKPGQKIVLASEPLTVKTIEKVMISKGLSREEVLAAGAGEIVTLMGLEGIKIGETLCDPSEPTALPSLQISEPTLHLILGANTSPLTGKEGKFSTSRQLEERLEKELETNLSLRVEKEGEGKFKISGRGELHLAVFLETLRREGYEMEVSKPEVITKKIDGVTCEPVEEVDILVPNSFAGVINQELGKRLAILKKMAPLNEEETEFIWEMPTRAIIGLRSLLLTMTKGTVLFNSRLLDYRPMGKLLPKLRHGVLIASEAGETLAFGLEAAQGRGSTFVPPGVIVYEGMIVGQNTREDDIEMNVCKGKKMSNMRSKASDGIIQLAPPIILSLEQSLDFLESDELLEITPKSLRLRKKHLTSLERRRHRLAN